MGKTVLLAEDDFEIRDLLQDLLEKQGYNVIPARTGRQALDFLCAPKEVPPDLVLLDLMMPIITGWQVLEAIRNNPRLAHIPVVVLTATSQDRPAGASAFFRKPFPIDALFATVRDYMGEAPQGAEHG